MTSTPADAQRLRDLTLLRRVRDRIDREFARPLGDPAGNTVRIQELP